MTTITTGRAIVDLWFLRLIKAQHETLIWIQKCSHAATCNFKINGDWIEKVQSAAHVSPIPLPYFQIYAPI